MEHCDSCAARLGVVVNIVRERDEVLYKVLGCQSPECQRGQSAIKRVQEEYTIAPKVYDVRIAVPKSTRVPLVVIP